MSRQYWRVNGTKKDGWSVIPADAGVEETWTSIHQNLVYFLYPNEVFKNIRMKKYIYDLFIIHIGHKNTYVYVAEICLLCYSWINSFVFLSPQRKCKSNTVIMYSNLSTNNLKTIFCALQFHFFGVGTSSVNQATTLIMLCNWKIQVFKYFISSKPAKDFF